MSIRKIPAFPKSNSGFRPSVSTFHKAKIVNKTKTIPKLS